jgi:hypothetical protein
MRVSFRQIGLAVVAAAALVVLPRTGLAQGRTVVGTYNTTISSPQGAVKAVIVLTQTNGTIGGTLAADGFPTMPVSKATPSDSGVTIQADTPDGGVAVAMKFGAGDKVTGTVVYQGMEMGLDGTFAPAGGSSTRTAPSPTGTYSLVTSEPLMGAANFDAQCTITKSATGTLAGTCGNSENGEVPVSSVSVDGNVVTISGETPVGAFKIVLTVVGTDATGTIAIGAETAKAKGTFTAK